MKFVCVCMFIVVFLFMSVPSVLRFLTLMKDSRVRCRPISATLFMGMANGIQLLDIFELPHVSVVVFVLCKPPFGDQMFGECSAHVDVAQRFAIHNSSASTDCLGLQIK